MPYQKWQGLLMAKFGAWLRSIFTRPGTALKITSDELHKQLIEADFTPSLASSITKTLQQWIDKNPQASSEVMIDWLKQHLKQLYVSQVKLQPVSLQSPRHVIMMVGINGAGKTTSCAKLAHHYQLINQSPLLVAGDTFRAGAVQQLKLWGERLAIPVIAIDNAKDPAAVVFEGLEVAQKTNRSVVIIDTAGRLQTKDNLMAELAKLKRVVQKKVSDGPHETLLVIDASLGQNVIAQATVFHQSTPLTGLVLTKLDGVSKGGIIWTVAQQLHIGVQWVGTGEKVTDWQPFDIDTHIEHLFEQESGSTYEN